LRLVLGHLVHPGPGLIGNQLQQSVIGNVEFTARDKQK
jgi:hypothetical protein